MSRLSTVLTTLLLGFVLVGAAVGQDTVYYYSSDTLGSEVVITDASRNVVERTYYAPYGQVLNRALRDGPGYAGHEEDPESSLVYMQQRYFDPASGRFLSNDPAATANDGGSFNRYAYANDNPYRYTDPTGAEGVGFWDDGENFATADHDDGLSPANIPGNLEFIARSLPISGDYLAARDFVNHPTWLGAGILAASTIDLGGLAKGLGKAFTVTSDVLAAGGGSELTRIGRWMSKTEFETMSKTGRVVEGAGGRTSVIRPPNPSSFRAAAPGSVYAEFNVPTSVLRQGGRPDWAIIPGPNITTRAFGPPPLEMPPATCIVCVSGN